MLAVDTNVVVRFLTRDDEVQFQAAYGIFASEQILLLTSVVLEVAWVLRSSYGYGDRRVSKVIEDLILLENVTTEMQGVIETALLLVNGGLDFADSIHRAASEVGSADAFATFDRALAQGGSSISPLAIREL